MILKFSHNFATCTYFEQRQNVFLKITLLWFKKREQTFGMETCTSFIQKGKSLNYGDVKQQNLGLFCIENRLSCLKLTEISI